MSQTPLSTLAELNALTLQLDEAQRLIDAAVKFAKANHVDDLIFAQLHLNQLKVNRNRRLVETMKAVHARNN